ncbi:hypothetical protein [Lysobacter xanthus]
MSPTLRTTALAALVLALAGCATAPAGGALAVGTQATVDGRVRSVDTAPWAYDGNATVVVTTPDGDVRVQLPARWNLCKAAPVEGVQGFAAGDRVRATGTVNAPGEITVCERAEHRLVRLP